MTQRTLISTHVPALFACIVAIACGSVATGQFNVGEQEPRGESAERYARVTVLSDRSTIGPHEHFNLVILFDIEPGWHIYWKNPGSGAAAPNVRVRGPVTYGVGEPRWPRPKAMESPVGEMYGYEGRAAIFVPISVPAKVSDDMATFTTDVSYAVCDHRKCFFGNVTTATAVNTNSLRVPDPERDRHPLIDPHRKRLPLMLRQVEGASAELVQDGEKKTLVVTGPSQGHREAQFFAYNSPGVTYGKPSMTFSDGTFRAVIELQIDTLNFLSGAPKVGGVIGLGSKPDDPSFEFELPLALTG